MRKVQDGGTPITSYLTPAEMAIFTYLGRLRFGSYVGTVGELYFHLTGRKHPAKFTDSLLPVFKTSKTEGNER